MMITMPEIFKMLGSPIDKKFERADLDKPQFQPDLEKDDENILNVKNQLSGLHDVLTLFSDVVKSETQMI